MATMSQIGTGIYRRELVLWTGCVVLANDLAGALLVQHPASDLLTVFQGLRFGLFDAVAWAVALWRLSKSSPAPARRRDTAFALILCLVGALLALTGLGAWLLIRDDVESRAAASLVLAIASHQLWGRILFNVVSPELLRLDAAMVGQAVGLVVKGVSWRGDVVTMPGGFAVAVLEGCASFSNVSAAVLAGVAFSRLERPGWVARDAWVGLATASAQVMLNVARLCLIAQSADMYRYWHDGAGAQLYAATASSAAVLIAVFGTRWAARAP